MAGMSDSLKNSLLDVVFNAGTYTPPTNFYIGLYIGDPDDAGAEIAATDYARVQHDAYTAAASGQLANDGAVSFGTPTEEWSDSTDKATHFGIFSALTGGSPLWTGELSTGMAIGAGNEVSFADGALVASL